MIDKERDNMPEPTNLLNGMLTILDFAQGSALSNSYFENVKIPMAYLCRRLSLTPTQVTLLSIIMDIGCQTSVSLSQIANYLDTRNLDILSKSADITTLKTRRFIVESRTSRGKYYSVPQEVYDAFRRNEIYTYKLPKLHNDDELAEQIDKMLIKLDDRHTSDDMDNFDSDMQELLHNNSHIRLARVLLNVFKYTTEREFRVVVLMSMFWIRDKDLEIDGKSFRIMFERKFEHSQMINQLRSGKSILVKKKIIKLASSDGLLSDGVFSLTEKFRKSLTPGWIENQEQEWSSRLTRHTEILKKEMFYNANAESEVARLQQLLQPERMAEVLERMKDKGLRSGFTCLFYGGPGTGKTETVLQLARACGRDIFQVDVSKLRSKWYGESERIVKEVFDEYRRIVKQSKIAPILFFNEADAIFNRRMENAERATDKGENALQNIILQEMETLDGILIATTNLQGNLDSAFERRFLYKLYLDNPTPEVKARIWRNMLPDLTEREARMLANQFDFSGGQIENVVRKRLVDEILTGKKSEFNDIQTLCHNEMLDDKQGQHIGFICNVY